MSKDKAENQENVVSKSNESKPEASQGVGGVSNANNQTSQSSQADLQATHKEISIEENTIETLKQQLEVLKTKADKNLEIAMRSKAELENVRKRATQEISNAHKYALERFIPELLPLLDGLEQGLNSAPKDQQVASVVDGITLCLKMFDEILIKFGVEGINPVTETGELIQFDPALHEAILMQPAGDVANGSVLKVVQKGYMLNKRVLRPARVIVAKS